MFALLARWSTLVSLCLVPCPVFPATARVLDSTRYHLGVDGFPEWDEFAGRRPHGRMLEVRFPAESNATAATLFLRQQDVKHTWRVQLNGRKLGELVAQETSLVHTMRIPPGGLVAGTNLLAILPPTATDDIVVGDFRLDPRSPADALSDASLSVQVFEENTKKEFPCRITVVDTNGSLAPLQPFTTNLAEVCSRPGVIYTRDGRADFGLPAGTYTVFASRGFEFSVATQTVAVAEGKAESLTLALRREVPTPGWVATDTHIHTLTHSKHGDALMEERMLTIAGEGIELAVATDHNHHADYADAAQRARLQDRFTAVVGNEVTTTVGHFNAFPISPGARLAEYKATNWSTLLASMRATPGVQVISLNHPRDLHNGFIPLAATNFNPVSGAPLRGLDFSFDALEVVTSAAMQSDVMLLFHDWFAMLNYGRRITALASSDTHDVSRFILGQGRSYVECDDARPGSIDVGAACQSMRAGRVLVSMGLWVNLTVNGQPGPGRTIALKDGEATVTATVLGPGWAQADQVELFANGIKVGEQSVTPGSGVTKAIVNWPLHDLKHDVFLVVVASGPGITAPFWEIPRPYQPSSTRFNPRMLAATNPAWLDVDGDGSFQPARVYAQKIYDRYRQSPGELFRKLAPYDAAVIDQAASIWQERGEDWTGVEFTSVLATAPESVRRGFKKTFVPVATPLPNR